MHIAIVSLVIFGIAILMTMTGRGGGNFYVLTLVLAGFSMQNSATIGQFILFFSSIFATFIFGKKKIVEWKLVFIIGSLTSISAFLGGFFSVYLSGKILKFIFSFFLLIAAIMMLKQKKPSKYIIKSGFFIWNIELKNKLDDLDNTKIQIDLKFAIPIIFIIGFGAGMVGVSGGSFLVPLMVVLFNIPMKIAVGTSTTLVAITAFMGFTGHIITGDFNIFQAIIPAIAASIGGLIGGKIALKTKPKKLKLLFAMTTLLAAIIMVWNAVAGG